MLNSKSVPQYARVHVRRRLFQCSAVLLLIAGLVMGLTFQSHWRSFAAVAENDGFHVSSAPAGSVESRVKANYGKLPLSFEVNGGQFDSRVKFVARGQGYDLFLTSDEAVLALAGRTVKASEGKGASGARTEAKAGGAVLRMKLVGANRDPKIEGLEELSGKINYFIGSDPAKWQTGIALYSKVQYKDVYRGIDLVYYGNQSQLEYDFVVAPNIDPSAIKLRFEGTERLAVNKSGELTLVIPGGAVSMHRPVIFQQADDGTRREIDGRYAIKSSNEVGFEIKDYDASKPLVIDPILSYSTYLGSSSNETGYSIAADADGNAYVTGTTGSSAFPVTGTTFTTQNNSGGHAFVTKLNAAGSALIYSTYVGGSGSGDIGYDIALDASRNAYVVGRTDSNDFPTLNAFKTKNSFYKSVDGAQQWTNNSKGLDRDATALAVDPTAPSTVYAGTTSGLYKSTDAGANWQRTANAGLRSAHLTSLAVDPSAPATIYAGSVSGGFFKSTNRGESWTEIILNSFPPTVRRILFDPTNASTIYLGGSGLYKSTNGGASWTLSQTGLNNYGIESLAIDALTPTTLYAGTFGGGLFKSTDGGANWSPSNNGISGSNATYVTAIAVDPTNSTTVYAGTGYSGSGGMIFKSTNAGANWSAINNGVPSFQIGHLIVSATTPSTVYAATTGGGVVKTTNGGASWSGASSGLWGSRVNVLVATSPQASTLYAGTNFSDASDQDGFIFKLNAAGNALIYSTYLGGANFDSALSVAVDGGGHAVVAGNTSSTNFPAVNARQPNLSGTSDAFVTRFDPSGASLVYSTYLGGSNIDEAGGVAVDTSGNAYVTGSTASTNFPVTPGAFQTTGGSGGFFGGGDAFVTKIDAAGASFLYSTYLGGTNGVEAGYGIAVDGAGHAYVVGYTESANFPIVARFHPASGVPNFANTDAFAAKLNPSGSGLVYSSTFGGSSGERARDIALDADENAYITGTTGSTNFPLVAGALKNKSSLFRSTDGGTSWSNDNYGLNAVSLLDIAVDPSNSSNVYGATREGIYKSTDGGRNWSAINSGLTSRHITCLAIDHKTPSTLYAGTSFDGSTGGDGVYKSTNGGASWARINNGFIGSEVGTLTIDPLTPTTLYATNAAGIFRTTDGGANWARINTNRIFVLSFVIDPTNTSIIYTTEGNSGGGVFRSTDGGVTWNGINNGIPSPYSSLIAIDPVTPTTLYVSTGSGVLKSTNSGTTWAPSLANTATGSIAVDPANPSTIYVGSGGSTGNNSKIFRSTDGGATWQAGGSTLFYGVGKLILDPRNSGTIFTAGNPFGFDDDAFVTKVNAAGTAFVYSTYFGGGRGQGGGDSSNDAGYGIATDGEGNAYVTGTTRTQDFPVSPDAYQPVNRGFDEAFVAKFAMSFSIGGQVLDANGVPQNGVEITLSGARADSVITAGDGRYSFFNLRRGASYTVSATRTNFSFTPHNQTFDNLDGDRTLNFVASASTAAFHTIGGRIVETDGTPLPGVQVSLGGSQIEFTTTDANGAYAFTAPQNGNYTVTPSLLGFGFSPPSLSIVNLNANRTADFSATRLDFVVTNTNDHGAGSLRQAILDSNATSGANTITFNIPQPGVQTISPTSPLPTITDPVVINAATQPGFAGTPLIELDGTNVGLSAGGLRITAGNSVVRGLVINRFPESGIILLTGGNNRVEGNVIGLDPTGTVALANRGGGIAIGGSSSNLIGGTTAAARNVISGNLNSGISLTGSSNQIKGNYIGTDAAGTGALGNSRGIDISNLSDAGSNGNVIGGTEPGARNIISGNSVGAIQTGGAATIIQGNYIGTDVSGSVKVANGAGIQLNGAPGSVIGGTTAAARNIISGNTTGIRTGFFGGTTPPAKIQGNYIGTNATGTAKIGNGSGIMAYGGVIIGGTEAGAGNLISGNSYAGLHLQGCCSPMTIAGNFIGTDASGNLSLGNLYGVLVSSSQSVIGGTTTGARNVISGNETGIYIGGQTSSGPVDNVVQGNLIGMNASGTAPLPNTRDGIYLLDASGSTIGGSGAGAANVIAFNGGAGVAIAESSINNAVRRNRIFSNAGLGIDLIPNGVTANDAGDADTGANNQQNFPFIAAVTRGAQSTGMSGTLNSKPNTVFTIEVFSNSACDASGSGEGAQFFHVFETTTGATGAATFDSTAPLALPADRTLTMTATDPAGNTSEFSTCQFGEARGSVEFAQFAYAVLEDVGQAIITLNRVGGNRGTITVGYSTADQTATAGADYTAISGTLTFAEGETSKILMVPVFEDNAVEPEERATLTLTADDPETLGGKSAAVLSIFDSNTPLTLSVERQTIIEGNTGTTNAIVKVTLSAATGRTVAVDYTTASGTAVSGSDFQPTSGTLTFAPGTTTQSANVVIIGDIIDEPNEIFRLVHSNPASATVFSVNNVIVIGDDDEPPAISVSDVSVLEGNSGFQDAVFNINLSAPSGMFTRVSYATANGTATAGSDYTPLQNFNFVDISPGQTIVPITVRVVGDTTVEADETFFLNLSSPINATLIDRQGMATIRNDDNGAPALLTLSGRVRDESGNGVGDVTITLGGSQSATTQTVANGQFFLRDLPAGGNYVVTPSKAGYVFEPPQLRFDGLSADTSTANFVAVNVPATLQFGAANFTSDESAGSATITVTRTGTTANTASIDYATTDDPSAVRCDDVTTLPGVAFARCDYATAIDTLTFAPGEQSKTFNISLVDDAHVEGAEKVQLRLLNPSGAVLGAQSTATLTINDADAPGAPNPIFTTPFFVRMQYLDFLSREPEAGEPWSKVLNDCPNVNNDSTCDRILVSQSFFGSPEFRLKGFFVYNFYRVAFNRRPEYTEIIADMRRVSGATAEEVYAKRAALPADITARAEFKSLYDALNNQQYVDALMNRYGLEQITTNDPLNPEGGAKIVFTRAELVTRLGAQALTRAQVLRAIVESNELGALEYNSAFVAMQYYGYLRRTPEEDGYNAWLRVINEDPQNVRIMVNGFMNSPEYRLRFGQP